jgi:hypothetical protein
VYAKKRKFWNMEIYDLLCSGENVNVTFYAVL